MDFKDHFSSLAKNYAAFRPTYPDTLFSWLAKIAPERTNVWDCACGNGQASQGLAKYFDRVIATDASAAQIEAAKPNPKIDYRVAPAEQSGLSEKSVDLVTVAQALHWFNFDSFYIEVKRVLKPEGVIAVWCVDFVTTGEPVLIEPLHIFCRDTLGPYWPTEIQYVLNGYKNIPFPFDEISTPPFSLEPEWTLAELMGYFRSFSATAKFIGACGFDPVDNLEKQLTGLWGDPTLKRRMTLPFYIRAGRV